MLKPFCASPEKKLPKKKKEKVFPSLSPQCNKERYDQDIKHMDVMFLVSMALLTTEEHNPRPILPGEVISNMTLFQQGPAQSGGAL